MKHHNPIIQLVKLVNQNKSTQKVNTKKLTGWLARYVLTEPLRQYEILSSDKKIRNTELKRPPIFILGHWRSGTSYLQYLLGRDPQFAYLTKFQAIFPDVFLKSEGNIKPLVKYLTRQMEAKNKVQDISVDWDWDSPSELDIAMMAITSPYSQHWGHAFPHSLRYYFDKYLYFSSATTQEREEWKKAYDFLIKKVTLHNKGKQALIKSPGNTARVKSLLELYPDAKFIYIHRNPYDVFSSNLKLWQVLLKNLSLQSIDQPSLQEIIIENYEYLLKAYLKDRPSIPEKNLVELQFESFVKNPVEQLQSAYEQLDIPDFDKAVTPLLSFVQKNGNGSSSKYKLDEELKKEIDRRWAFSFEEWPTPQLNGKSHPAAAHNGVAHNGKNNANAETVKGIAK